ncbi:hypothetical protein C8R45DRAFT_358086 [Mycena sanguinolenta]|nr:hypothetical protein C8R45DRAFT_358086 [Mycena sanguinolenta]
MECRLVSTSWPNDTIQDENTSGLNYRLFRCHEGHRRDLVRLSKWHARISLDGRLALARRAQGVALQIDPASRPRTAGGASPKGLDGRIKSACCNAGLSARGRLTWVVPRTTVQPNRVLTSTAENGLWPNPEDPRVVREDCATLCLRARALLLAWQSRWHRGGGGRRDLLGAARFGFRGGGGGLFTTLGRGAGVDADVDAEGAVAGIEHLLGVDLHVCGIDVDIGRTSATLAGDYDAAVGGSDDGVEVMRLALCVVGGGGEGAKRGRGTHALNRDGTLEVGNVEPHLLFAGV